MLLLLTQAMLYSPERNGIKNYTDITQGNSMSMYTSLTCCLFVVVIYLLLFSYPGGFREILAKRVHEKDKTMVQLNLVACRNITFIFILVIRFCVKPLMECYLKIL